MHESINISLTTSTPTAATVAKFLSPSLHALVDPTHFTVPLNTSSFTDFSITRSPTLNFD